MPMKVGFKTGPKSWEEGQRLVVDYGARYAELWYRYDKADDYQEIFRFFEQHEVAFGLHYWGVVEGNILPNFCYDQAVQYRQGIDSVKEAIDVASKVGATYVNIHPGSRRLTKLNEAFDQLTLISNDLTPEDRARELLLAATTELSEYAQERGVLFLVETIPAHDAASWNQGGRNTVLESHQAPTEFLLALAERGYYVANDFGHTAANRPQLNRDQLWDYLYTVSQQLAPQTKLLHVNTLSAPFNGTDSHDGILSSDWQCDVFPNEAQLKLLLALYLDRPDVWARMVR